MVLRQSIVSPAVLKLGMMIDSMRAPSRRAASRQNSTEFSQPASQASQPDRDRHQRAEKPVRSLKRDHLIANVRVDVIVRFNQRRGVKVAYLERAAVHP